MNGTDIVRGSISPIQGWAGYSSRCIKEIDTIIYKAEVPLPSSIITLIQSPMESPYCIENLTAAVAGKRHQNMRFQINSPDASYDIWTSSRPSYYDVGYFDFVGHFMAARLNVDNKPSILYMSGA